MYVALAGGVGGAKLVRGLSRILPSDQLIVAVNTGDDFEHLGLHISPDLDSVMYAMAGLNDRRRGWGMADESWAFMDALERLGGETWFRLGDKDLATHVERTRRLAAGETLSEATTALCSALGIRHHILPASEGSVPTVVVTDQGRLSFQDYFVKFGCRPVIRSIDLSAAERTPPIDALCEALRAPELRGVILCPSNPFVSIDPILALDGMRELIAAAGRPIVAVSPIIGGRALKGPAAKMFDELGIEPSVVAVAHHYEGLIDGLVFDLEDRDLEDRIRRAVRDAVPTQSVMHDEDAEMALAQKVIESIEHIAPSPGVGTGN